MCPPPTPSSLCGTWFMRAGMNPATSVPVVSVRYLPTAPLEFPSPLGNSVDLELSRSRADSQALAASTTTLAPTCSSRPLDLFTNETPAARPARSTVTSRAIALVRMVSRPVLRAGARSTPGLEKFELRSEEHTSELQSRENL